MKIIDFVKGLTFHKTSKDSVFFKELKKILGFVGVTIVDPCCDTEATIVPVRYNTASAVFESLDPTDSTWSAVASVSSPALATDSITESTSGAQVTFAKNTVQNRTAAAINVTATATAAQIKGGLITSTSAAAVALTLPLATDLATSIGAVQGTSVDFMVDNSAGANTVTVTPNTGITAVTAVVTGGATLTVASGAVGIFRIFFTSATVAKIARII